MKIRLTSVLVFVALLFTSTTASGARRKKAPWVRVPPVTRLEAKFSPKLHDASLSEGVATDPKIGDGPSSDPALQTKITLLEPRAY